MADPCRQQIMAAVITQHVSGAHCLWTIVRQQGMQWDGRSVANTPQSMTHMSLLPGTDDRWGLEARAHVRMLCQGKAWAPAQ